LPPAATTPRQICGAGGDRCCGPGGKWLPARFVGIDPFNDDDEKPARRGPKSYDPDFVNGKAWNREDDTIGVAGGINGISSIHAAYLNDGGIGIVVGDGQLPHPGLEQIFETYYSYALATSEVLSG
jgi:Carbohydrate-selective porin, OprB family